MDAESLIVIEKMIKDAVDKAIIEERKRLAGIIRNCPIEHSWNESQNYVMDPGATLFNLSERIGKE